MLCLLFCVEPYIYSRICLIRHLKGIKKSDELGELPNYANK